jgi:hypothetical protein
MEEPYEQGKLGHTGNLHFVSYPSQHRLEENIKNHMLPFNYIHNHCFLPSPSHKTQVG